MLVYMIIAELHGKLSCEKPANERMEDVLTSNVFGAMKFVGWQYGFFQWLQSAQSFNRRSFAREVLPATAMIECVHYRFWPTFENGREPDLIIGFETSTLIVQLILESKYLSGSSNIQIDRDDEKFQMLSGNQIADQINFIGHFFPNPQNKVIENVYMLITSHWSPPSLTYEQAKPHILRKDVPIYWTNWQSLPCFLQNMEIGDHGRQEMINDLLKLFARKKLIPFDGFKDSLNWEYRELIGKSFWRE